MTRRPAELTSFGTRPLAALGALGFALPFAFALAAGACGSSDAASPAGSTDGGGAAPDDAGPGEADAGAGTLDGGDAGGADAGWKEAPHDPFPEVPTAGGPVLAHPALTTVTFAGYAYADDMESWGDWVVSSPWLTAVGADYGVASGTHAAKIRLTTSAPTTMTDADVRTLLAARVADHTLPAPTADTLYALYLPPTTTVTITNLGASCVGFSGYHSEVTGAGGFAYAVVGACDGYVSGLSLLENVERTASHELIEAATDPRTRTTRGFDLDDPSDPWSFPEGEIADICRLGWIVRDGNFLAQRVWSNAAARAGAWPCAPAPGGGAAPYFNVSVAPSGVVSVQPGQVVTLKVRGWSTEPVAPWVVHVPSVSVGDFAAHASLDKTTIGNGDEVTLTLTVPASATSGGVSYLRIASAATTAGLPLGDFWPVTLRVP